MRIIIILIFLQPWWVYAHKFSGKIKALADDFYPVQYIEQRKITGPATKLVKRVLAEANVPYTIEMQPWARTYYNALTKPDILIYSLVRTAEREHLFYWVGEVMKVNYYLYGLPDTTISADAPITELNKYNIATVRQTATALFFEKHHIKNVHLISNAKQALHMLFSKRVDLIPGIAGVFEKNCLRDLGDQLKCEQIKPLYKLNKPSTAFYIALSKKTDINIVNKVRLAYQKVIVNFPDVEQQIAALMPKSITN